MMAMSRHLRCPAAYIPCHGNLLAVHEKVRDIEQCRPQAGCHPGSACPAGFLGAGLALLAMPMARTVAAGLLATGATLGLAGFARGGFSVNHMDIAPRHAGVVMGISNTAGTVAGRAHPSLRLQAPSLCSPGSACEVLLPAEMLGTARQAAHPWPNMCMHAPGCGDTLPEGPDGRRLGLAAFQPAWCKAFVFRLPPHCSGGV